MDKRKAVRTRVVRSAVVVLLSAITLCGSAQQRAKQPWEWTLDERIAARCDRSAARVRVERAREQRVAPTTVKDGALAWHDVKDVIIGRQTPHLLLPSELFESVVRNGFLTEGWREAHAPQVLESGLPSSFWSQLEGVAATYIDDLREQRRLAKTGASAPGQHALALRLCASRSAALARARAMFGPALDVFLYRYIAAAKTLQMTHDEDAIALKAREQGCR